jgi:Zn finger protein HypA/HybF involved in hydrogenase expression
MELVREFLDKMEISEEDALQALLAAFSPLQASALRQNWMKNISFGNSAPSTADIWRKFEEANFKCSLCGSQYRITLDHADDNPRNHSYENLVVLCFECNRARSTKATRDKGHQLRIYRAVIDHYHEFGTFPTNGEILRRAGVEQIGGSTYMIKWLKDRLVKID